MINGVNLKEALVVGIDPGVTTAIAILDVYGNLLNISSKRNITRSEIINHVIKFGKPVIIASDVKILPKSVERIATKFECTTYSPEVSLSLNEKNDLTSEFSDLVKNDHELDALAASKKAWKNYKPLLSKIIGTLKRFGREDILSEIISKVIKESSNIEDAIREFIEKEQIPKPIKETETKEEKIYRELVEKLQKKLNERQQQIDSLMQQTDLLNKALNEVRKKLGVLRKSVHEEKEGKPEEKNKLEILKKLRKIENKGYYPLIEIDRLTLDSLEKINHDIDLENRVVTINATENLNLLNKFNIKCIVLPFKVEEMLMKKLEFPILQLNVELIEKFDDIKAIKIDYIEKEINAVKKSGLIEWLKDYKKRKE